jgi:hypothetical protein
MTIDEGAAIPTGPRCSPTNPSCRVSRFVCFAYLRCTPAPHPGSASRPGLEPSEPRATPPVAEGVVGPKHSPCWGQPVLGDEPRHFGLVPGSRPKSVAVRVQTGGGSGEAVASAATPHAIIADYVAVHVRRQAGRVVEEGPTQPGVGSPESKRCRIVGATSKRPPAEGVVHTRATSNSIVPSAISTPALTAAVLLRSHRALRLRYGNTRTSPVRDSGNTSQSRLPAACYKANT